MIIHWLAVAIGQWRADTQTHTHIRTNTNQKESNDIVNDQWFTAIALNRKYEYSPGVVYSRNVMENCVSALKVSTFYVRRSNDKRKLQQDHTASWVLDFFFSRVRRNENGNGRKKNRISCMKKRMATVSEITFSIVEMVSYRFNKSAHKHTHNINQCVQKREKVFFFSFSYILSYL